MFVYSARGEAFAAASVRLWQLVFKRPLDIEGSKCFKKGSCKRTLAGAEGWIALKGRNMSARGIAPRSEG